MFYKLCKMQSPATRGQTRILSPSKVLCSNILCNFRNWDFLRRLGVKADVAKKAFIV